MNEFNPHDLAKALLREAAECGRSALVKTILHKLFYLVDLYYAEEHEGATYTEYVWKFVHFGPFSVEAARTIEALEKDPIIAFDSHNKAANDDEYFTYRLRSDNNVKDLRELGLSGRVQRQIQQVLRSKCDSLNDLLEHVYFATRPMESATPGSALSFSDCRKIDVSDFRPLQMKALNKQKVAHARQLIRDAIAKRTANKRLEQGPFDALYFEQIGSFEEPEFGPGAMGQADLNF